MVSPLDIEVFHGEVTPHSAQIYARVEGLPGGEDWTIAGWLRGPECRLAKTLPTNHVFTDLGAGQTLLARAFLPDPCFWSPELPALYRVTIEVRQQNSVVHTEERELGVRFLGTQSDSFYWENKRWVLRGVSNTEFAKAALPVWRDAGAAMLVKDPSDELCCEASHEGVLLVACTADASLAMLRRLARWAAVGIVVTSAEADILADSRRLFPNLMLAQFVSVEKPWPPSPACSAVFVAESVLRSSESQFTGGRLPIIAVRRLDSSVSLAEGREACDTLQRDLAPIGDFAGYVVTGAEDSDVFAGYRLL